MGALGEMMLQNDESPVFLTGLPRLQSQYIRETEA
jgi:hypothetical protein